MRTCVRVSGSAHGVDLGQLDRVVIRKVLRRAEPGSRADVVAAEELDVAELSVRGCGDRAFAARFCGRDAPVERGGSLLVLALGRVDQGGAEREQGGGLERSIAGRSAAGDRAPEAVDARLDRAGAHGGLAGLEECP